MNYDRYKQADILHEVMYKPMNAGLKTTRKYEDLWKAVANEVKYAIAFPVEDRVEEECKYERKRQV